jgi:hypothetical protein
MNTSPRHFAMNAHPPHPPRHRAMRARRWVGAVFAATTLFAAGATAATTPSRNLYTYVIFGLDKIQMKEFFFSNLGNIGVNNAGGTLYWGRKSYFSDGSQVVTDILNRSGDQSSVYDLFANQVFTQLANITVRDDGPLPWAPAPLIAPLPATPSCTPGTAGVSVPKGGDLTLPPGSYAALRVANGATLELTGGSYCFADVKLGRKAKIVVDAPSNIVSMNRYVSSVYSRLVPADGSGIGAADISVGVAGKLVRLSHRSKIFGVFFAPNATMRFGRGGNFTGQFVARVMRSDFSDTFTLEACGNGVVDPGEECDAGTSNGEPGACCTATCDFRAEGTPCPDGNLCNGDETCSAFGQCRPGAPLVCNDHNLCTRDECDPQSGCTYPKLDDGTSCSDGVFCNGPEVCNDGECTSQPPPDCTDGDPCTVDACDPGADACVNPPVDHPVPGCDCPNGDVDCDNHNACDGKETCDPSHTFCHPGVPLVCTTTNQCLDPFCDPQNGCGTQSKPNGTPCDDGDACTFADPDTHADACTGSVCGGFATNCDDGDPCTNDSCDSGTGACSNTPISGCGDETFCSLTQGAYGAGNGIANGANGWITNNLGILPQFIGAPGTSASVTVNTQAGLIAFLPTGGTSGPLDPIDLVINGPGDVLDPTSGGGSGGNGGGTLAGQALSLKLSVALSNAGAKPTGFGNYQLQASFCTCDATNVPSAPFTISQCILDNAVTVDNLISLADQALRGATLSSIDPCLTYSGIEQALDALNKGFDTCRTVCPCAP